MKNAARAQNAASQKAHTQCANGSLSCRRSVVVDFLHRTNKNLLLFVVCFAAFRGVQKSYRLNTHVLPID